MPKTWRIWFTWTQLLEHINGPSAEASEQQDLVLLRDGSVQTRKFQGIPLFAFAKKVWEDTTDVVFALPPDPPSDDDNDKEPKSKRIKVFKVTAECSACGKHTSQTIVQSETAASTPGSAGDKSKGKEQSITENKGKDKGIIVKFCPTAEIKSLMAWVGKGHLDNVSWTPGQSTPGSAVDSSTYNVYMHDKPKDS